MIWAFYLRSVPFTRDVLDGTASLGGSESACVGVMRALSARGHLVLAFAHDLAPDAVGRDAAGVVWQPAAELRQTYRHWEFDVFVSLRMIEAFHDPPEARWRVMWNQDLLIDEPPGAGAAMTASSWPIDTLAYVSAYHRKQWEGLEPALTPLGWVTRNGYDPTLVPTGVSKDWRTIIHISRPERGLAPLLRLWPAVRARVPEAQLQLCRYSSMYDAQGWGQVCAAYDADVARVNEAVGGITYLGELGKPALYEAVSRAAVMWYPGISTFAETSCIAAIEAQACGTPFVGSARGALPETVPSGVLLDGAAEDPGDHAYEAGAVNAVVRMLEGCRDGAAWYADLQARGHAHVDPAYTFAALAELWEQKAEDVFTARVTARPDAIVKELLNREDHVAARVVLSDPANPQPDPAALARAEDVIHGREAGADEYYQYALADPVEEGKSSRFRASVGAFTGCTRVLDVACGNGTMAFLLAQTYPEVRVHGVDYSPDLVRQAQQWAAQLGVQDRVTFETLAVYDYERHMLTPEAQAWVAAQGRAFDGLFVGEFLEHCADPAALIDGLEAVVAPGGVAVYTMPRGPFMEMRAYDAPQFSTHVHAFEIDDIQHLFGAKAAMTFQLLDWGVTHSGSPVGNWLVGYRVTDPPIPTGTRDLAHRIRSTRPRPTLSVGILCNHEALDLRRCLTSVRDVADEIVLGDSSPPGKEGYVAGLAAEFGARVVPIASPVDVAQQPDGFAGARNDVLQACHGDWFLWIDSDETLEGASSLRKYLSLGSCFRGFAVRQIHLMLDAPQHHDTPVRVFRRVPEIKFYGCVHEQPQWQDANGDIFPALELRDVQVAHIGYRTEGLRRTKSNRNLPLLARNHERFPTRRLNGVLDVRECALRARDAALRGDQAASRRLNEQALHLWETHFSDPADRTGQLARPFYEMALSNLGQGWTYEYAFAGTRGEMNGKTAQTKRLRVRRYADLEATMLQEVRQAQVAMHPPPPDTTPLRPS